MMKAIASKLCLLVHIYTPVPQLTVTMEFYIILLVYIYHKSKILEIYHSNLLVVHLFWRYSILGTVNVSEKL